MREGPLFIEKSNYLWYALLDHEELCPYKEAYGSELELLLDFKSIEPF